MPLYATRGRSVARLCTRSHTTFLLDEADVFLGTHTNADLARNELVAGEYVPVPTQSFTRANLLYATVFLIKLEYFPASAS